MPIACDAGAVVTVAVAHCRAGFENEAAIDLRRLAAAAGIAPEIDAPDGRGFVVAATDRFDASRWQRALAHAPPIFVRSLFVGTGPHRIVDDAAPKERRDRIAPLCALLAEIAALAPGVVARTRSSGAAPAMSLRLETADTNQGKKLSPLARALAGPLAAALAERAGVTVADERGKPRAEAHLHALFVDGGHAYVGASAPPWASLWPMGIPRLAMPRQAPSRSTLKLAEAIATFAGERESVLLRAGMRAVDLGAAPGGWTWQLARRGLSVTAVDNGPLRGAIRDDPLVTHLRADGLRYVPPRPVDWLVCDVVEQPRKIAALVARWIAAGLARHAIFNLKLPMKQRYDEVRRCEAIVRDALAPSRGQFTVALRQLYHDRSEVTGCILRAR